MLGNGCFLLSYLQVGVLERHWQVSHLVGRVGRKLQCEHVLLHGGDARARICKRRLKAPSQLAIRYRCVERRDRGQR